MFSSYQIIEASQSDSDDCVIVEDDITDNLDIIEKCTNEPPTDYNGVGNEEELEQEDDDDVLVVGCDSDDDIDGILNNHEEASIITRDGIHSNENHRCHEDIPPQEKLSEHVKASEKSETRNTNKKSKRRRKVKSKETRTSQGITLKILFSETYS